MITSISTPTRTITSTPTSTPTTLLNPPPPLSRTRLFLGTLAFASTLSLLHLRRPVIPGASSRRAQSPNRAPPRAVHTSTTPMFGGGDGFEVPCKSVPTAAVIFLHGLGDSGIGWSRAFPMHNLDYVRAILPNAVYQPVTLNGGMSMPSWFDIRGLHERAEDDEQGILEAVARVNRIIDHQISDGIAAERIVVAGFSQGGAVALTAALRSSRKLAGCVALSTWLPLSDKYPGELAEMSRQLDIFMGHGTADQVVGYKWGHKSSQLIHSWERKVEFHSYPGLTHSSSNEEMEDVRNFIQRLLPRQ